MSAHAMPKITPWRVITALIFAAGLYATYARFLLGLQASTNLADPFPWGLWVGLGTLCGVGLSASGFAIAAAVYLLGMERYRPVLRASILISFLGYLTVVAGMFFELGLPWRIYHPILYWNRRSVLFEVAWCVMLYTTVLTLEFAPAVVEKLPFQRFRALFLDWHHRILIALVLVGVLLSSLHQSFLGGLYLITKGKLYPLWYSPYLPTLFYLSAIPAGLSLAIMALYLCNRSLGTRVEFRLLANVGRLVALLLGVYGLFRFLDLATRGAASYLWQARPETGWFWVEMLLLIILPVALLSQARIRNHPLRLYWAASLVVAGFMANRLNVSITGLEASAGYHYVPKWTEMASTVAIIAAAVVVFRFVVLRFDVFPRAARLPQPPAAPHFPCLLPPEASGNCN